VPTDLFGNAIEADPAPKLLATKPLKKSLDITVLAHDVTLKPFNGYVRPYQIDKISPTETWIIND
jgi:hypothetical protein